MIDTHVHSNFSADSDMDVYTACEQAIKAGLDGIAFTDHLDIDFPDFDVSFTIDFLKYNKTIDNLKQQYKGRFKVLKGIEVGIQPHVLEESREIVRSWDFDYVIGSTHIIDGVDPYKSIYYQGKTKKEAYTVYLQKVLFTVCDFDVFDTAGHIDYIIRNADYADRSLRYNDYSDLLDEIFKCLISAGKGIEINTASYRERPGKVPPEFDINILTRFRELGGEIVTLGSDSHTPEYIGYKFDYFRDMLKHAGFRYVTYFEARKPVFELL